MTTGPDASTALVKWGDPPPVEKKQKSAQVPYMSYARFKTFLDGFRADGLPARLDASYFGSASGSLVAQTRGTLKFFELITEDRVPTPLLQMLAAAESDDEVQAILRDMFEDKYQDIRSLAPNATYEQLADALRQHGVSGATVRKSASFFIAMAEDVGAPVSSHFKRSRSQGATGNSRRRRSTRPTTVSTSTAGVVPDIPAAAPAKRVEDQRSDYVAMLMDLAKSNPESDSQEALLDRIERALGITATGGGS